MKKYFGGSKNITENTIFTVSVGLKTFNWTTAHAVFQLFYKTKEPSVSNGIYVGKYCSEASSSVKVKYNDCCCSLG